MFSPFTIFTSFITGGLFPLLGSVLAVTLGMKTSLQLSHLALVMVGGFTAHWILAHTIHDIYHYDLEKRKTLSKKNLKVLAGLSAVFLLAIAIYLSFKVGWPVLLFSLIGALMCLYGKGLMHHEAQMGVAAFFLVIGGFYVQAETLELTTKIWLQVLCIGFFAFFSQYGWLLFYRLDDYEWDPRVRNKSILIAKIGLLFLIGFFLIGVLL